MFSYKRHHGRERERENIFFSSLQVGCNLCQLHFISKLPPTWKINSETTVFHPAVRLSIFIWSEVHHRFSLKQNATTQTTCCMLGSAARHICKRQFSVVFPFRPSSHFKCNSEIQTAIQFCFANRHQDSGSSSHLTTHKCKREFFFNCRSVNKPIYSAERERGQTAIKWKKIGLWLSRKWSKLSTKFCPPLLFKATVGHHDKKEKEKSIYFPAERRTPETCKSRNRKKKM